MNIQIDSAFAPLASTVIVVCGLYIIFGLTPRLKCASPVYDLFAQDTYERLLDVS